MTAMPIIKVDFSQQIPLKKVDTFDLDDLITDGTSNWSLSLTVDDDLNLFTCDSNNRYVKCFNSDKKQQWTSEQLKCSPYDIAILQTGEIAVSFVRDRDKSLLLLDRRDGRELRSVCHGIKSDYPPALSVYTDNVVICDSNEASITVFKMSAYQLVKQRVISRNEGKPALERPHHVLITPELEILVTDCDQHTVQSFSKNGQHQFTYGSGVSGSGPEQLNDPCDVCTDQAGNILVADHNNDRVVLLSPKGAYLKDLLTKNGHGLSQPRALALSRVGKLYVLFKSGSDTKIQVFQQQLN